MLLFITVEHVCVHAFSTGNRIVVDHHVKGMKQKLLIEFLEFHSSLSSIIITITHIIINGIVPYQYNIENYTERFLN